MAFFVFRQNQLPDGSLTESRIATGRRFATNGDSNDPKTDAGAWIADHPRPGVVLTAVEVTG
jgi:hypothetical protein